MIHIYRTVSSVGARTLSRALGARRAFNLQGVRPGDTIVAWGEAVERGPLPAGIKVLNGGPIRSKLSDAEVLKAAGVSTVEVARTRPILPAVRIEPQIDQALRDAFEESKELAEEFSDINEVSLAAPFKAGLQDLISNLTALHLSLNRPVIDQPGGPDPQWIGRASNHVGGKDLLNPVAAPDYWTKRETFTSEYRVHSFDGKSIRGGKKIPREGFPNPHEWIRSWDGGWMIAYDGQSIKQRHRDIAHAAIKALGLDFGAVDIGERADKSLVVLEVNRAPGIEGQTVEDYVRAINRWIEEQNGARRAA